MKLTKLSKEQADYLGVSVGPAFFYTRRVDRRRTQCTCVTCGPRWSILNFDTLSGAHTPHDVPTVTDYPDSIEWGLWAEGTFTLLDGGTLDIGIVRDMELVSKNDYCMFTEQFLAVAKTGLDSLWVTQSFNVNGGSAGTLDVASVDY